MPDTERPELDVLVRARDDLRLLKMGGYEHTAELVQALIDEIDRLRTVIDGCGCPAPYDACTHDEPLTKTIERLRADNAALHACVTTTGSTTRRGAGNAWPVSPTPRIEPEVMPPMPEDDDEIATSAMRRVLAEFRLPWPPRKATTVADFTRCTCCSKCRRVDPECPVHGATEGDDT